MKKIIILLGIIGIFVSCQKGGQTENCTWPTSDDSVYIEKISNRKIIDIDTTILHAEDRQELNDRLENERVYVDSIMRMAFDDEMPEGYCVVHFFYKEQFNCHMICPDMFVYLSDSTLVSLKKNLNQFPKEETKDSLITENFRKIDSEDKQDTIYRTIKTEGNDYIVTLEGKCWGSCSGFTTIVHVYCEEKYVTIHEHHRYFCQTHDPISYYEYLWRWQQKIKKHRDTKGRHQK